MYTTKQHGFTLIELLIVVAIIGILAAIAVPNFMNAQIRAKIAKVQGDMRALDNAYMSYRLDNGNWPPHLGSCSHQHRPVTTPIAYMTSSVYDPFQKEEVTETWHWFCGQYHAEPHKEEAPRLRANAPKYFEPIKNAAFYTKSVGPDMDSKALAQGKEFFVPYDATNGLMSLGTIYRPFQGEGFRDGYPYTTVQYPGFTDADFGCHGCDS
ncbi:MAG: type II secretion system protein [bacterium]